MIDWQHWSNDAEVWSAMTHRSGKREKNKNESIRAG